MTTPLTGFSVAEFRTLHGYGESAYKALQKAGLGPVETLMPGTSFKRITPDDYKIWLKLISTKEVQHKEWLRRRERYSAQGRQASLSPGHPAQVWAKFKRMQITKPVPPKRPRKHMEAAE
jgi:hypothetical protein